MRTEPDPFRGPGITFWIVWAVIALSGVAFTGVLIWAVIRLVQHFT